MGCRGQDLGEDNGTLGQAGGKGGGRWRHGLSPARAAGARLAATKSPVEMGMLPARWPRRASRSWQKGIRATSRQSARKGEEVKSLITLRDTWSKRQAGAMKPVRRASWVWAASCAPVAKKNARAELTCAGAAHEKSPLVLCCGGFPVPVPPRGEMRRGAWECNTGFQ